MKLIRQHKAGTQRVENIGRIGPAGRAAVPLLEEIFRKHGKDDFFGCAAYDALREQKYNANAPGVGGSGGSAPEEDPARRVANASLVLSQIRKVLGDFSDSRLYVAPNIPYVMLKTAADKYAHGVTYPQALVLLDDCILFGGAEGVCITEDAVWWKITGTAGMIPIGQIRQVRSKAGGWIRPAKIFLNDNAISIFMGDKHRCADALARIISYLVRAADKIHFQCPKCSKSVSVRKEYAGKRGKCPGCGDAIPIPSTPGGLAEQENAADRKPPGQAQS